MSGVNSGYDDSAAIYSPEGRVFQVEYAAKAVDSSGAALAIKCTDGVAFAVEKAVASKLICPKAARKTHIIAEHIGSCVTGLTADGRFFAKEARKYAEDWISFYGEQIPTKVLVERIASVVHEYTIHAGYRPFGVTALIGGCDEGKYSLFCVEPTGAAVGYLACSAGRNKPATRSHLEKLVSRPLTVREGLLELAKIIYETREEQKDKLYEIELSWICDESNKRFAMVPDGVAEDIIAKAKEAAENAESESSDDELD